MDKICLICLFNFINEERIRKLSCGHYYHLNCIDRWLTYKNNCPSCRRTVSLPGIILNTFHYLIFNIFIFNTKINYLIKFLGISYSAENLRSGTIYIKINFTLH